MSELVKNVVVVFDNLHLRRTMVETFLSRWAFDRSLRVVGAKLSDSFSASEYPECGMRILSVGGGFNDELLQRTAKLFDPITTQPPVVVFSDSEVPTDIESAYRCGAKAFIPTSTSPHTTLAILSFILDGGSYFPPEALLRSQDPIKDPGEIKCVDPAPGAKNSGNGSALLETVINPTSTSAIAAERDNLTKRQSDVLEALLEGKSNKEIARILYVSESTVKVHVRQIMRKFGVANRTQAAILAANVKLGKTSYPAFFPSANCKKLTPGSLVPSSAKIQ